MEEIPKNRLTFKESMTEGRYVATLTKEEKTYYKELSIDEKRKALNDFNASTPQKDDKVSLFDYVKSTMLKHGLDEVTSITENAILKNEPGKHIDSFMTRLSSFSTTKDSGTVFTYELINQNFVVIKILDEQLKQNKKIIEQNNEIISLLKQIANKGEM
ncbi:hypothetical protein [Staphylococcus epidermidis]|uniref:hypothetical protein n=1 Tax=Staphylococcus epidermidis TaxID=1282 RepID=UPI000207C9AD|nr:hypothetical protein [Staphylococcus epidermidis]EGG60374.1 hypothetical protein SEVCU144_1229 [Staphylococcus epidermidis VCU144]